MTVLHFKVTTFSGWKKWLKIMYILMYDVYIYKSYLVRHPVVTGYEYVERRQEYWDGYKSIYTQSNGSAVNGHEEIPTIRCWFACLLNGQVINIANNCRHTYKLTVWNIVIARMLNASHGYLRLLCYYKKKKLLSKRQTFITHA